MRPFVVILGILLGSLFSIAFGLCVVLLVFWVLQSDHPRFAGELPAVAAGAALFSALAGIAAAGFVGTLRERRWRFPVLGLLWAGLFATGWFYWP